MYIYIYIYIFTYHRHHNDAEDVSFRICAKDIFA